MLETGVPTKSAKVEGFCLGFFYQAPEGFIGYYEHSYNYAD